MDEPTEVVDRLDFVALTKAQRTMLVERVLDGGSINPVFQWWARVWTQRTFVRADKKVTEETLARTGINKILIQKAKAAVKELNRHKKSTDARLKPISILTPELYMAVVQEQLKAEEAKKKEKRLEALAQSSDDDEDDACASDETLSDNSDGGHSGAQEGPAAVDSGSVFGSREGGGGDNDQESVATAVLGSESASQPPVVVGEASAPGSNHQPGAEQLEYAEGEVVDFSGKGKKSSHKPDGIDAAAPGFESASQRAAVAGITAGSGPRPHNDNQAAGDEEDEAVGRSLPPSKKLRTSSPESSGGGGGVYQEAATAAESGSEFQRRAGVGPFVWASADQWQCGSDYLKQF